MTKSWMSQKYLLNYFKILFAALAFLMPRQKLFFLFLSFIYVSPTYFFRPKSCVFAWHSKWTLNGPQPDALGPTATPPQRKNRKKCVARVRTATASLLQLRASH
jgi:hypothetical protein